MYNRNNSQTYLAEASHFYVNGFVYNISGVVNLNNSSTFYVENNFENGGSINNYFPSEIYVRENVVNTGAILNMYLIEVSK